MNTQRLKNKLVSVNTRLSQIESVEPIQMAVNFHKGKMLIGVQGSGIVLSKFADTDFKGAIYWLSAFEDGLIVAGLDE